jgi:putative Mg2+ transporter-C (MgtC) family protein
LSLRRLDSTDLEGGARVVVTAFVTAPQRVDTDVEKIVGRLSLEPTVSAARWQADVRIEVDAHAGEAPPPLGASPLSPAEH